LPLLATGSGPVLLAGENAEFVRVFLDTHPAGAPRRQRRSVERYNMVKRA
jgi:DNA-binding IclR family transcriptional regulator